MNRILPSIAGMGWALGVAGCALGVAEQSSPVGAHELHERHSAGGAGVAVVAAAGAEAVELPLFAGPRHRAPRFEWQALGGAHWQIVSAEIEDPRVTDAREGTRGGCPAGMVQVRGHMKMDPDLEKKQLGTCSAWASRAFPERCASFDRDRWLELSADMPVQAMDYCIDRFEYPNLAGQSPAVFVSATESAALCAAQGKRLCSEDEWTFACEGEEAQPYANGYDRDAEACNIDGEWRPYSEGAFAPARGRAGALEMDRLWQGRTSGASPACKSPFGVHDMSGNVDEWTQSTAASGGRTILKGGYWGPVRARCRPSTRSHDEHHQYYQQGFRCCA
jgi:hypothetical protein